MDHWKYSPNSNLTFKNESNFDKKQNQTKLTIDFLIFQNLFEICISIFISLMMHLPFVSTRIYMCVYIYVLNAD